MIAISFLVIVWFVSCFSAQLERLFQEWMTRVPAARLQIYREKFPPPGPAVIIL
jgi:hypothetical protein